MKTLHFMYRFILWPFEPDVYTVKHVHRYYSKRYKKWVTVPLRFKCDGSSWSPNVGWGWLFHDWLFFWGKFDDGTPCKWRQANRIMKDIMAEEDWPKWVYRIYHKGVKTKWSYKAWKEHRSQDKGKEFPK